MAEKMWDRGEASSWRRRRVRRYAFNLQSFCKLVEEFDRHNDLVNDRPIDLRDTPYSIEYHKGLVCSAAKGGAVGGAAPIVASTLPAWATTAGGLGLAGYGVYVNGEQAVEDFDEGNYFQGTYHLGMAGLSGAGGYQIGRPLFPYSRPTPQQLYPEYMHYRNQGFSARDAHYLTRPYSGMGHHYLPRRWELALRIQESPYNVMGATGGMSRGCFYERHFRADPFFYGTKLPGGTRWSGRDLGLIRPDVYTQSILGLPNQTTALGGISVIIVTPDAKHR